MDYRRMIVLLVGMLCVTAICIYGNADTAPSALTLLTTLLSRQR